MSVKTYLLVDSAIFAAILVAFEPALTGIAIHEWLSLALFAAMLLHIVLHWDWVVKLLRERLASLPSSSSLQPVPVPIRDEKK